MKISKFRSPPTFGGLLTGRRMTKHPPKNTKISIYIDLLENRLKIKLMVNMNRNGEMK